MHTDVFVFPVLLLFKAYCLVYAFIIICQVFLNVCYIPLSTVYTQKNVIRRTPVYRGNKKLSTPSCLRYDASFKFLISPWTYR